MKVLYVFGDTDYAALTFEQELNKDVAKYWKLADEANGSYDESNDNYDISFNSYEFGEVDPKFLDFIRNEVQDYDDQKHSNFYIVE